jgi:dihydroxyacid dehydratase/phosphogluconate dehydratase
LIRINSRKTGYDFNQRRDVRVVRMNWNLAPMSDRTAGLDHGLTDYGDRDFSRYLRRSFAQSMGYSREMLNKPVIGIAYTGSDFNNCRSGSCATATASGCR